MTDRELAIKRAKVVYAQKKAEGVDFSQGPCLAEEIIPDWCADIAHDPRQPIDNVPMNQCNSYQQGLVHHFVELDLDGNVIRAV